MTATREQRVNELYAAALQRPAAGRPSFVAREAAGDLELQHAVEALLARDALTEARAVAPGLAPGEQIGPYRIDALLGVGGMGVVYRATDTRLGRAVAIKLIVTDSADAAARERFRREAKMASALNHPHILTVYDVGEHDGREYLVTELVDGGTAEDWANPPAPAPRPTWRQIVDLLTGVADGLAAAHAANVLHRDVKPTNVLVSRSGQAKLADFGLAKLAGDAPQASQYDPVTRSGLVVGTADYMSPEQALGQPLDARSDIFSFGVLLYELLAGRRPFGGATGFDRLQAIVDGAFTPLPAELPEALRGIVEKALEREPADRYQSMRDLVVDLRRVARRTSVPPSGEPAALAPTAPRRRPALVGATTVLAVAVLGGGGWWYRSMNAAPPPSIGELVSQQPVTAYAGSEVNPSFAPDGDRVAFSWGGEDGANPDIYVAQLGSTTPQRLTTDPAADAFPRWSPDGSQIAFFRRRSAADGDLMVIPALGGQERKVADMRLVTTLVPVRSVLSWTPNGRSIVFSANPQESVNHHLYVVTLATGRVVPVSIDAGRGGSDASPLVSPDGRWLAFTRYPSGPVVGQVMVQRLRPTTDDSLALDGQPFAVTNPVSAAHAVAWSPRSDSLVLVDNGRTLREWPARPGSAVRTVYTTTGFLADATVAWKNGRVRVVAALANLDFDLFRVTIDPATHRAVGTPERRASSTLTDALPQLSPDGTRLMFVSDRTGNQEIWLADADGENARQLTRLDAALIGFPGWSHDGKRVVFHARIANRFNGEQRVYIVDVDGTGIAQQIGDGTLRLSVPSWAPDGEHVFAETGVQGHSEILRVSVADGTAEPLVDGDVGRVAPNDDRLFYVKVGQAGIFSRAYTGDIASNPETEVVHDYRPLDAWQSVIGGVYYVGRSGGATSRLRFLNLANGETTDVFDAPIQVGSIGPSLDGARLWYSSLQGAAGVDLTLFEFADPAAR